MIRDVNTRPQEFTELRRSTRVALEVSIQVEGELGVLKGETVVVNLHGALISTVNPISLGSQIEVTVYLTGKAGSARVVYVVPDNPLTCGIELERPQNIWGVSLLPDDWEEGKHMSASR